MLPITLVAIALVIGIGLIIQAKVFTVLDGLNLGTQGNATRTSLETNTWSGFDLAAMLPIVIGGAAVITVVIGALYGIFARAG